ncbi:lytic enzyme [Neisseria dentiae]|uniref:lytic enzyme n=1 Tax=Neisseria dentiae TaxID=194197 RepID=UPI0035A038A6
MNELDHASERLEGLIVDMVKLMTKYQNDSEKIVGNLQKELDKSLAQQRQMMVAMVREELLQEASHQVESYTEDMEEARNQMLQQVGEFNTYLRSVKNENQKIFKQAVLGTAITLAALIIGGIALVFFYSNIISQKKLEADMLTRINNADIVQCGNNLCAKTGKAGANGYRIIQNRR